MVEQRSVMEVEGGGGLWLSGGEAVSDEATVVRGECDGGRRLELKVTADERRR